MPGRVLLNLFDRPTEPVFMPKGRKQAVFDVPTEYLADRFKHVHNNINNRFVDNEKIPVKKITLPDISVPMQLGRRDNFSLFLPSHRKMAARLIDIFMGMRSLEDFISVAVYCRDRLNPYMYVYALSVAILHRDDTRNLEVPSLSEVFPDKFIDGELFARAKEEATNAAHAGDTDAQASAVQAPLEIPRDYTANDLEAEHRVAYFREDLGINLHHWHWHLAYPFDATPDIVVKDRRGEMFYYMHEQVLARYNFERFCNNLGRAKRLLNWREPIEEGYFPKLDSLVSSRVWPPRFAHATMKDIAREVDQIKFDVQDLERWRDRIYAAIHGGQVVNEQGETIPLTESRGIDILGNMVESSNLSVNRNLYGDLHNLGHISIALCHDPDAKNLETFSVMGDPATAMRDPVFYRWHAFIDDMFQEHKSTLPRYTIQQLDYPGVRVTACEVVTAQKPKNRFYTFWQQNDVDLSNGIDFSPRGSVFARFTHLQHTPFTFVFQVDNATGQERMGTVRIFIAPKFDERGLPWSLRDQRNVFVELDKFVVKLRPGNNLIERESIDSSVTIPFERTFRDLTDKPLLGPSLDQFNHCGCGWPEHMLIPKGTPAGFPSQLFAMVSNYDDDRVEQKPLTKKTCTDAASYCGIRDNLYPDKRAMGFPFDRQPRDGAETIALFLSPNMVVKDVFIEFSDTIVPRKQQVQSILVQTPAETDKLPVG